MKTFFHYSWLCPYPDLCRRNETDGQDFLIPERSAKTGKIFL